MLAIFGRLCPVGHSRSVLRHLQRRPVSTADSGGDTKDEKREDDPRKTLGGAAIADADSGLGPHQLGFRSSSYPDRELEASLRRHRIRRERSLALPQADDDSDQSVLLFPGQGAQYVGMGKELLEVPGVREMYDRASQTLDYDLLKICLDGPKELLDSTVHCQPAVVVTSLAAVEKLYRERPEAVERCKVAAGFSVGEITALIFSGAISFDDGVLLVKSRAEAMQYCSEVVPSGMMTVFFGANAKLGLACEAARRWVEERAGISDPICQVANFLYTGAKVIAGHEQALSFIEENRSDFGIRQTKRLAVSGAFHTPLMNPAFEIMKEAVAKTAINEPRVPVHSCAEMRVYRNAEFIRKHLPYQVIRAVKWEQAMHAMFKYDREEHIPQVFECGPGGALCAMLRKINGKAGKRAARVVV